MAMCGYRSRVRSPRGLSTSSWTSCRELWQPCARLSGRPQRPRPRRNLAVPDLAVPDLAVPDLAVPDLAVPDLAVPDRPFQDQPAEVTACPASTAPLDPRPPDLARAPRPPRDRAAAPRFATAAPRRIPL